MRYNEKELFYISTNISVLEGRLHHKRIPPTNFTHPGFRERWFKLVSNCLFYYHLSETGKIDEKKPLGVLILVNYSVRVEADTPFAFSITFDDEVDKKHIFSGRSEEYVLKWTTALKQASYEYWRSELFRLQTQISVVTGRDPLLMIPRNDPISIETFKKPSYNLPSSTDTLAFSTSSSFQSYVTPTSTINIKRSHQYQQNMSRTTKETETVDKSEHRKPKDYLQKKSEFEDDFQSIISSSILVKKAPPPELPKFSSTFGNGLYVASAAMKSSQSTSETSNEASLSVGNLICIEDHFSNSLDILGGESEQSKSTPIVTASNGPPGRNPSFIPSRIAPPPPVRPPRSPKTDRNISSAGNFSQNLIDL